MGRPKNYIREELLEQAMLLFWQRGYADTGLQDLEKATGANKSALYAEFKSKEGLFLAALRHYKDTRKIRALLSVEPYGWSNIEKYLQQIQDSPDERRGCFAVNSMRDLPLLPPEAREIMAESRGQLKQLFKKNIEAEGTRMPAAVLTELLSTFFSGLCIEKNAETKEEPDKVQGFMAAIKLL